MADGIAAAVVTTVYEYILATRACRMALDAHEAEHKVPTQLAHLLSSFLHFLHVTAAMHTMNHITTCIEHLRRIWGLVRDELSEMMLMFYFLRLVLGSRFGAACTSPLITAAASAQSRSRNTGVDIFDCNCV
jgi:tRNA C32,U32 (ribose-2'-O)-methylase TrmJ